MNFWFFAGVLVVLYIIFEIWRYIRHIRRMERVLGASVPITEQWLSTQQVFELAREWEPKTNESAVFWGLDRLEKKGLFESDRDPSKNILFWRWKLYG